MYQLFGIISLIIRVSRGWILQRGKLQGVPQKCTHFHFSVVSSETVKTGSTIFLTLIIALHTHSQASKKRRPFSWEADMKKHGGTRGMPPESSELSDLLSQETRHYFNPFILPWGGKLTNTFFSIYHGQTARLKWLKFFD